MPQGHETQNQEQPTPNEVITLGGGCFWCTQAMFTTVRGVENTEAGYAGGHVTNPTYSQVTTGTTGHAEVVQITFDPQIISGRALLDIFFAIHDPTTMNRQGTDSGPHYRSVIFYRSPEQKTIAEQTIHALQVNKTWKTPIVTQIEPMTTFYKAEKYHQKYFEHYPEKAYCRFVIAPKHKKFTKQFEFKLKVT